MSLLLTEGFELNVGAVQRGRKYVAASGGGIGSQVDPRVFGTGGHSNQLLQTKQFAQGATLYHGWGIKANAAYSGFITPGWRTYFQLAGVNQCSLSMSFSTDGRQYSLLFKRGDESGTLLATFGPFWADKWYYFEMRVTAHTSTGSYEFVVNDVSYATGSGLNTAGAGTNDLDQMKWQGGGHTSFIDDMYVDNAAFRGPLVVAFNLPSSNGATVEYVPSSGTNHANLLNDQDDTTLVTTNALNQIELLSMSALNAIFGTGVIVAISWEATGAMTTPGSRQLTPRFRTSGGSSANGPTALTFDSSSITNKYVFLTTNPQTTVAWVPADLGGQFGFQTTS